MSGAPLLYITVKLASPPCPDALIALRPWTMDKDRELEVMHHFESSFPRKLFGEAAPKRFVCMFMAAPALASIMRSL